ncbi:ubiquinol-cytochrome C reductase complex subunit oxen [Oratosquilla oratoria]|uniref:ubiquinol-cytochrome C reductase complex subunit oxen n=1 Tax=Oratosquilla oratoria TaxID=337810 RepID=UPI003F75BE03
MSEFVSKIYQNVFRRTSSFAFAAIASAFFFERGFDLATDTIWDAINQGKLYKHIKHKFDQPSAEEEEDDDDDE